MKKKKYKKYKEGKYLIKEYKDRKVYFFNGKLHREDGPAFETVDGHKEWYLNGCRHREDGSAIQWEDGSEGWYLAGYFYTEQEHKIEMRKRKMEKLGI